MTPQKSGKLDTMSLTTATQAIILKRIDYGEADRIVTLFTSSLGKRVVMAKGVRKLSSKRLGSLEPGTHIKALLIKGKGMDILGQTSIITSFQNIKSDLTSITQLYQLLEIVDILTKEEQELPEIYDLLTSALTQLECATVRKPILLHTFQTLVHLLGFIPPQEINEYALKQYIETIAERRLNAKDFLTSDSCIQY